MCGIEFCQDHGSGSDIERIISVRNKIGWLCTRRSGESGISTIHRFYLLAMMQVSVTARRRKRSYRWWEPT